MHRRDFVLTLPIVTAAALTIGTAAAQQAERPPGRGEALAARRMKRWAGVFLASLPEAQRSALMFPLDSNERTRWSNLPVANVPRVGVPMGDLDDTARRNLHALLRASASSQGYLKMAAIMQHDDELRRIELAYLEHNPPRPRAGPASVHSMGSNNYWIALFGKPAEDEKWGWLLTGHHLAATFTCAGERVTFLPLFLGSAPNEIPSGAYAGARALSHEASRAIELVGSLRPEQRQLAVISGAVLNDVVAGPGRQQSLASYEGLPAGNMDEGQQRLLWALVEEYVRNADFDSAEAQLAAIREAGLANLHFSWRGPTDDIDAGFYYRIHGPRILIEYAVQEPNHIHTITRDPSNDYGADWLGLHYQEHSGRG